MSLIANTPHTLRIDTPTETRTTGGGYTEAFVPQFTWPCFVQPASESEAMARGGTPSERTHVAYGPARRGTSTVYAIPPDARAVHGSRTFEIMGSVTHGEPGLGGGFPNMEHLQVDLKEIF